MQFVLVTGLSGSGKSVAMNILEDIGFYCIDNMPPQLLIKFAEICNNSDEKISRVAIAADIRAGDMFSEILESIDRLKNMGMDFKILYFEASDEVLFKRYKETRRKHPLDSKFGGDLNSAIKFERNELNSLREIANYYIDTTFLSNANLKEHITEIFLENASDSMIVQVMSFGFKYGLASEGDLIFDVRCLPNPFYIPEMKMMTGFDSAVRDYVLSFPQSSELIERLKSLIDFLLPLYVSEGKSRLVIAFGCTGGKHRSVVFTEDIAKHLKEKEFRVNINHRDISKS